MSESDRPVLIPYCRQSQGREHETRETSLSLESQEDEIRAWGQANGYQVERAIRDHDLVGDDPTRAGLAEMEARTRPGVTFAVFKWDRLARSLILQETIVHAVERRGGSIVSIREPSNKLTRAIFGAINEDFKDALSDRLKAIRKAQALRGDYMGGQPPYGYRRAGTVPAPTADGAMRERATGPLVPDEREAPAVRDVFRRYLAGESQFEIAKAMNELGVPRRGGTWNVAETGKMIRNPVYAGKITHKGVIVADGKHEPLVDAATFAAANERLARMPARRHQSPNQLASWCEGLIRHGCGRRLYLIPIRGKTRKDGTYDCYPNFACRGLYDVVKCPVRPGLMSAAKVEWAARECLIADLASIDMVSGAIARAETRAGGDDADRARKALADRRALAERRRARARESWMTGLDDLAVWHAEHERYLAVIAEVDAEAARLPVAPHPDRYRAMAVDLASFAASIETADDEGLRRALDALGSVVVDGSGVSVCYHPVIEDFIPCPAVVSPPWKLL
jgi:DNA invertase Pin-like site-specific DNA recombinase